MNQEIPNGLDMCKDTCESGVTDCQLIFCFLSAVSRVLGYGWWPFFVEVGIVARWRWPRRRSICWCRGRCAGIEVGLLGIGYIGGIRRLGWTVVAG